MKRAVLIFVVAFSAAMLLAQRSVIEARAQCGFDQKTKEPIPCEPGKERRAKPTQVPPTETLTPTPDPTATDTPKPTETNTPLPTASSTAVAALIVPTATPSAKAADCSPSPLGLIAGLGLLGAGGFGYYLSRKGAAPGNRWWAFRGAPSEGVLPGAYRPVGRGAGGQSPGGGRGAEDGFAYESSGGQQQLINTAFGGGTTRANDRLRGAGPSPHWWGSLASVLAMLIGGGTLLANGLASAGLVPCGTGSQALVTAGFTGVMLAIIWKQPVLAGPASGGGSPTGLDLGRLSIEDAVMLLFMLISQDSHRDTREQLEELDARRRKRAALKAAASIRKGSLQAADGPESAALDGRLEGSVLTPGVPPSEVADADVRYTLFLPDGTPARGTAHVAMKSASKTPAAKDGEGRSDSGDTSSATEQRQRGRDVFQDLNEHARSTRLRATIEVREDPPPDQPPSHSDEADEDTATNGKGEEDDT